MKHPIANYALVGNFQVLVQNFAKVAQKEEQNQVTLVWTVQKDNKVLMGNVIIAMWVIISTNPVQRFVYPVYQVNIPNKKVALVVKIVRLANIQVKQQVTKKMIAKPVKLEHTKIKKGGHCVCLVCLQNIKMKHNQLIVKDARKVIFQIKRSWSNVINVALVKRPRNVPRLVRHVLRVSMVPIVLNVMLVCIGKMKLVPVLQFVNRVQLDNIKRRKAVHHVFVVYQVGTNHKKEEGCAKIATKVNI